MTVRKGRPRSPAAGFAGWRESLPALGLLGLVVGVLLLTWALRAPGSAEAIRVEEIPPPEPPATATEDEAAAEPTEVAAQDPENGRGLGDDPYGRALVDGERLRQRGTEWTAQILFSCDADNARAMIARFGGDPRLYVLPAESRGASCFRLCWGTYPTADDARRADGLPPDVRAMLGGPPSPKDVASVVP